MPIYEYEHVGKKPKGCDERVEATQRMSDEALKLCPKCGQPVKRVISMVAGHINRMGGAELRSKGFQKLVRRDKGVYEKE